MAALDAPVNLPDNNAVMTHAWNVLGLTVNQVNALTVEGADSSRSLSVLQSSAVTDMAKRLSSLPVNRGGARIGAVTVRKLQATLLVT